MTFEHNLGFDFFGLFGPDFGGKASQPKSEKRFEWKEIRMIWFVSEKDKE